jgi:porin
MGEWRARNRFVCVPLAALAVACGGAADAAEIEAAPPSPHPHAIAAPVGTSGDDPLQLEIAYTADIWQAESGGIRRGAVYLDNLDILVEADLGRLFGWNGATAFAYGLYNNGRSLGALTGDAQTVSNIETDVRAARLYEAWLEQQLSATTSLRVGLYDLNAEFDALETSALFVGSAHGIGTDISQTGENGPSIFPVTSLAARLAWGAPGGWKARVAVLDGTPGDPARPRRTAIRLEHGDGALLIGEVEAPLPAGKLLLGYWRYTSAFDTFGGGRRRGNDGLYLRGETRLMREAGDAEQGLAGFFRLGLADGRINMFGRFASAGVNYAGLVQGRDEDQIGLAVAAAFTSSSYRKQASSDRHEVALELTYRMPVTSWLTVQPSLHYLVNPGADPAIRDALAMGLRTELSFRF